MANSGRTVLFGARTHATAWNAPLELSASSVPRTLLSIIVAGAAYLVAARFGVTLAEPTRQVAAIWPATGVALAALLVLGYRVWPGVCLAALLANTMANEPLALACCIAAGNTATGLLGARALRVLGFDATLQRSRDVVSLLIVAIGTPLLSATAGTITLLAGAVVKVSELSPTWWTWWAGDSLGILIVAPVLLTWCKQPHIHWHGAQLAEFAGYVAAAVLISLLVFVVPTGASPFFFPRAYVVFPLVAWAGLRMGAREAVLGVALIAGCALWGALHGHGPFARAPSPDSRMVLLAAFIATVACTALLIAAVIAERQGARTRLREAYEELEERVRERTAELAAAVEELGQRNQEKETLLREIHHRVKNNLQVVCSLLNLQAHGQDEPRLIAFAAECRARVRSMALVHEHLYRAKNLQSVPLALYLGALVSEVTHSQPDSGRITCRIDVQDIVLPVDQAIPCGLMVNELVTNAFKHAFPDNRTGRISVSIAERSADRIELVVKDDGIGIPEGVDFSRGGGFGLALVAMLSDQLDAQLDIERHPGTRVHADFARRASGMAVSRGMTAGL